jgi:molybdopterin/thiamine biosynthesis adenylyltransferase
MKAWFENNIQRLQTEIDDLKSLNVLHEIDQEAFNKKLLRVRLKIEGNNPNFNLPDKTKTIELVAVYPDTYPYFRPNVYCYDISLPRHQNPLDSGLCLLGRPTDLWDPNLTLARFLQQQLAPVLVQGQKTDHEDLSTDPNEQPEPVSEYFNPAHTLIFEPSTLAKADIPEKVKLMGRITIGFPKDIDERIRAAVLDIKDAKGFVQSELPGKIKKMFPNRLQGLLYSIPELQLIDDPIKQFEWLQQILKEQGEKITFRSAGIHWKKGMTIKNVIGLNFPEEVAPGKKEMTGWIFIIIGEFYQSKIPSGPKVRQSFGCYGKASFITISDFQIRIPKLKPIAGKTISLIGLGALGSVSAIEFARNGVGKIRLLDYDTVDAATIVRYPLGISYAGVSKTRAIKEFIELNYPYTEVEIVDLKIGQYRANGNTMPLEILKFELDDIAGFIEDASLIYDASAEEGVSHYFSQLASQNNIPFISIWAMPGAVGGKVLRIDPGKTEGCWMCSMWHSYEQNIAPPPYEQSGKIQARGCGDVSFTGTSFDLQNISNAGVRMAISTLCEGEKDSYPPLNWDVAVMALVDNTGRAISPQWTNYKLLKHPNCKYCNGS